MHYCMFVMIGLHTDTEFAVFEALAPFDEQLKVAPFRDHLDLTEVRMMAKHYSLDSANLHELATHMNDWRGRTGGVDREGLYSLSTGNPDGRWDWYEIGGRWNRYIPHSRSNTITAVTLARAEYLGRCLPYFIVTPDGEWLERERYYTSSDLKSVKKEALEEDAWLRIVRDTLLRWPKHRVVCVDIHA